MYVHLFVWVHMCRFMHACTWNSEVNIGCLHFCPPRFFLGRVFLSFLTQGLLMKLELTRLARLVSQKVPGILCLCCLSLLPQPCTYYHHTRKFSSWASSSCQSSYSLLPWCPLSLRCRDYVVDWVLHGQLLSPFWQVARIPVIYITHYNILKFILSL